jgi:peroxiredoxin
MRTHLLILLLLISGNVSGQYLPSGSDAIDFTARSEDQKDFKLSDLKGKYVLLEFTATGCGYCWKSYPHLTEVQDKFKDTLQVATFHVFDTLKTRWNSIAAKQNIQVNWIQLWDVENKETIMNQYKIDGMPIFYLINPEGKIVSSWFGYKPKKLDRLLNKHLLAKN